MDSFDDTAPLHLETLALRAGQLPTDEGSHGEPIFTTSSYVFESAAQAAARFSGEDEVISSRSVFGTTNVLFEKYLKRFGVKTTFVSLTDISEWQAAITPKTKLFFMETPSNPLCEVANIPQMAELAHNNGALLVVDNCFCTPAL